ncbi:GNAT family protein [Nocardia asteroides]|uniref:GNAT family N-acetyltransferase n=1 Tax=Nocardia asteroides TaxID=1824 RepID=UPI00343CDB9A
MSRTTTPTTGGIPMDVDLARLTLGPIDTGACTVRLRPPRLSDGERWRTLRLRDRDSIEPYWSSSPLTWEQRHSPRRWARECLVAWTDMRAGRGYAGVVEIDGQLAGQLGFQVLDAAAGVVEITCWIETRWSGHRVMSRIGLALRDHLVTALGVTRIVAPISVDNAGAARFARALGFRREAVMARSFDAGGSPRDHALWALTSTDICAVAPVESAGPAAHRRGAGLPPAVLVAAGARLFAWRFRQRLRRHTPVGTVALSIPGHPDALVRSLVRSDAVERRRIRWAGTHQDRTATTGLGHQLRDRWHARSGPGTPAGLVLVWTADGRYAGEFRLSDPGMSGHSAHLTAWADPAHAATALHAAALAAVTGHAFGALGLRRLAAEIPTGDTLSARLFAAAGFVCEGVLRDHPGPTGVRTDHELWALTTTGQERHP